MTEPSPLLITADKLEALHLSHARQSAAACRLVHQLAQINPWTDLSHHAGGVFVACLFCEMPRKIPHKPDCLWLLARQLDQGEHSPVMDSNAHE